MRAECSDHAQASKVQKQSGEPVEALALILAFYPGEGTAGVMEEAEHVAVPVFINGRDAFHRVPNFLGRMGRGGTRPYHFAFV